MEDGKRGRGLGLKIVMCVLCVYICVIREVDSELRLEPAQIYSTALLHPESFPTLLERSVLDSYG